MSTEKDSAEIREMKIAIEDDFNKKINVLISGLIKSQFLSFSEKLIVVFNSLYRLLLATLKMLWFSDFGKSDPTNCEKMIANTIELFKDRMNEYKE